MAGRGSGSSTSAGTTRREVALNEVRVSVCHFSKWHPDIVHPLGWSSNCSLARELLMPKRTRIISDSANADIAAHLLQEVETQAVTANSSLQFLFQSDGIRVDAVPLRTLEGIQSAEDLYRHNYAKLSDRAIIEYNLALFLGQVMVEQLGCRWIIYPGKYYVFNRVVLKIPNEDRYVQPFLICHDLHRSKAAGSFSGTVLLTFAREMQKSAQP